MLHAYFIVFFYLICFPLQPNRIYSNMSVVFKRNSTGQNSFSTVMCFDNVDCVFPHVRFEMKETDVKLLLFSLNSRVFTTIMAANIWPFLCTLPQF